MTSAEWVAKARRFADDAARQHDYLMGACDANDPGTDEYSAILDAARIIAATPRWRVVPDRDLAVLG